MTAKIPVWLDVDTGKSELVHHTLLMATDIVKGMM
jgi:hypothetical protein